MAFLYRLLPPRPTFNQDMTAEESEVFEEHGSYWMGLLQRGTAVAYGPVLDPAGVWGLAIIDLDDEATAGAVVDDDPAVSSGVCTYQLIPMQLAKPDA
jgi:uncharacterized protein